MEFIFIDTFALIELTRDYYDQLLKYLKQKELYLLVTPTLLIEYHSPIIEEDDRITRAVKLFNDHQFVIANQDILYQLEEETYPLMVNQLPIQLRSDVTLTHLSPEDRATILYQLLHNGIPEAGYNLNSWAANFKAIKANWEQDVERIVEHATEHGHIQNKQELTESLNLRWCLRMEEAGLNISDPLKQDEQFVKYITKLSGIFNRHDSDVLQGIHLTSLIIWYDYIIANKRIKNSDLGDIYHAMMYPYCKVVIADNSRVDCLHQIQRREEKYRDTKFYNIKAFRKILNDQ
jgi:hypothetical protein